MTQEDWTIHVVAADASLEAFRAAAQPLLDEFDFEAVPSVAREPERFVLVIGDDPARAAAEAEREPDAVVGWVPLALTPEEGVALLKRAPVGPVATFALGSAGMRNAVLFFAAVRASRGASNVAAALEAYRERQTAAVLQMELPRL